MKFCVRRPEGVPTAQVSVSPRVRPHQYLEDSLNPGTGVHGTVGVNPLSDGRLGSGQGLYAVVSPSPCADPIGPGERPGVKGDDTFNPPTRLSWTPF